MSSILFIGGTRSGKSRLAETWAEHQGPKRLYVATTRIEDEETKQRVLNHQARRKQGWQCLEAPYLTPSQLNTSNVNVVLIDCLSMWLNNHMAKGYDDNSIWELIENLAKHISNFTSPVAIVSNEIGLGMVPMSELARRYRDMHGQMNQAIAQACQNVLFVSCGLPLALKGQIPQELNNIR